MKHLQLKYNLLMIFYFICNCTIVAYAAVFLKWKGFSNTYVGIVVGISDLLMIITSPYISSLPKKFKNLTLKKLIIIIFGLGFIGWTILITLPLPDILTMLIFMFMVNTQLSVMPLLSVICMDYLKGGHYLNFGSARGLGSLSYASAAFVLGLLVDFFDPRVLAFTHYIFGTCVILICLSLPDVKVSEIDTKETKEISMFAFIKKYPLYMGILLGIMCQFLSANMLNTYMINIVEHLGGNTSLYGVVTFLMAASELPFMSIAHSLMKKHKMTSLFIFSSFFYIMRNFLICLAPNMIIVSAGMLCQGMSYGLFFALFTYYCNDAINQEDQMMGQTMITVMTSGLGSAIGCLVGGRLQDALGLQSMLNFAMVMTAIGFIIVFITCKKIKNA